MSIYIPIGSQCWSLFSFVSLARGPALSVAEKEKILSLFRTGARINRIANELQRSRNIVRRFLSDPAGYGKSTTLGRPCKISKTALRRLLREASKGQLSSKQLQQALELNITPRRVRQILKSAPNLVFQKRKQVPKLTENHKKERVKWARAKVTWSQEQWDRVIFSDEKRFNLDGPDGLGFYWHDLRKEKQLYSKRPFGGGSIMIWASFSSKGKSPLVVLEGKQDAQKYCDYLLPFANLLHDSNYIYQHDNAPIHVAAHTKRWLSAHNIEVLDWPAMSPDLNPIENLWGILVHNVYANGRQFETNESVLRCINRSWDEISQEVLKNLTNSMQERCIEVLQSNGARSNY